MVITFMMCYWLTVAFFGVLIYVLWLVGVGTEGYAERLIYGWAKGIAVIVGVLILVGIWLPFFVPGLY